jgi:hypothetical protein
MAHQLFSQSRGPRGADFASWGEVPASLGNRRLTDGVFQVDLQKPWSDIARAGRRDGAPVLKHAGTSSGNAGEASSTLWLAVLEKARTFFAEDSDGD